MKWQCIEVIDDGVGFDATNTGRRFGKSGGFGLFNLRERFAHLGGHFRVESTLGIGTRVSVAMPIAAPQRCTREKTA